MCAIAFYSHKFFPDLKNDAEYVLAHKKYDSIKDQNTLALKKLKSYAKDTDLYSEYSLINKEKKAALKKLKEVKKNKEFLGFISLRHFVERFGLMLCFFIYALFNLIKSVRSKENKIGNKLIHSFIISVCFFYFFWIFQQFQDFSKSAYIFMTLFSAAVVFAAVYLIFKERKTKEEYLRDSLLRMARFTFKNTKPEKRDEMLEMIKKIAN